MSGVLKKTALAMLLSACLMVLFFFTAQKALESRLVREWIQSKINRSLPGDVTWKATRFSLIQGRLALEGITVSDPTGKTLISLDRLLVKLDGWALFAGNLNLQEIGIRNPRLHLQRDRDGSLNLVSAFSSGEKKPEPAQKPGDFSWPSNLAVEALKISGGTVSYGDEEGKTVLHVKDLEVSAGGDVKERKAKIEISFASEASTLGPLALNPGRWQISGNYEKDRISRLVLKTDFPGFSATLEGAVEDPLEASPKIQAEIDIQASLAEVARVFALKGEFSGTPLIRASVSGTWSNPEASLHLESQPAILAGQPMDQVYMDLSLKDRVAVLKDLRILAAGGETRIHGVMNLQKAFPGGFFSPGADSGKILHDYSVTAKKLQMATLVTSGTLLGGELGAEIKIKGQGLEPSNITGSAEFSITADALKTDGIKALDRMAVQGRITLDPGAEVSATLAGSSTGVALNASGKMGVKTQSLSAKVSAQAEDLGLLAALAGIENGGGRFSLQADLSGSVKKPVLNLSLAGSGLTGEKIRLNTLDITIRSRPAALKNGLDVDWSLGGKGMDLAGVHLDGIESRGSLSQGTLHLQQGDFTRGQSLVQMTGAVRLFESSSLERVKRPSGRLDLLSKNFYLEDFMENARGSFSIQSVVEGHPADLKGFVRVQGEKIYIQNQSIDTLSLNGELVKDRLILAPLAVEARNQALRVEGWVAADKTFQLKTSVDQSSLDPWFAGLNHPEFSGNVTGVLEVSGTAGDMASYGGRLALSQLGIFYHRQPLVNARQVLVLLENQRLDLKQVQLLFEGDRNLKVTGGISLEGESFVQASGRIPLSILRIFNENYHDFSGEIHLDGSMAGPLTEPIIHGDLQLMDFQTMVPGITQKIHNTRGRATVSPQAVVIESLTGQLDSGRFEFTGRIDLDRFTPVGIFGVLKSYRLPVSIPDTLDITLNTDLNIRGDLEKSTIDGSLVLLEGLYYKDVNLNPIHAMTTSRPQSGRRAEDPKPSLADGMALNISVRSRSPLVVDNNVSEMEIVPDLKIQGTLSHPIVLGRAHVESGQLTYRKRRFEIKKGVIDFLNPYKTETSLDIQGESRIRDWLVTLNLSGTPDELLFSFSSDPPLEEGDIFSLVVLGKTSGEMTGAESLSNQSAAQMVSRIMAYGLNEDLQKAMGLDILETEVLDQQDQNGANEMKVTVGKEINKRLTMKYSALTENGEIVQRTIAEYKFIENILVNVFQGTHGVLGGSIKYRLEWR